MIHQDTGILNLSLVTGALTKQQETEIVDGLRAERWQRWNRQYKAFIRQEFGRYYDIGGRSANVPAPPIPEEMRRLFPALRDAGWRGPDPTQCIVTAYPSGGGLGWHIDNPQFGPVIAGVSLEAEWPILFAPMNHFRRRDKRQSAERSIPLPRGSVYVMNGGARTNWYHHIPRRHGAPRISLTFRTMAGER